MKMISLFLFFMASFTAHAESIPLGEYDLVEFQFDVTKTGAFRYARCNRDEIKKGVQELVYFGDGPVPGRSLEASTQPLGRNGAWLIDPDACESLKPYFNGLGFESINLETGDAVAYITVFDKIDNSNEMANETNSLSFLRELYQPDFRRVAIATYVGHCSVENPNFVSQIWSKTTVRCKFDEENTETSSYLVLEKR